jgi:hypothetical protein
MSNAFDPGKMSNARRVRQSSVKIAQYYWGEMVGFLTVVSYTAMEAMRIPPADKLYFARANFAYWHGLEAAVSSSGFQGVAKPKLKASYAHASTVSAFCFLKNYRTRCRYATLGIVFALSTCVTWWIIIAIQRARSVEFILMSLATISIGVIVLIPIGIAGHRLRVGRLFIAGVVVSAASAAFLGVLGRPWELLSLLKFNTLNDHVFGLSLFSLALGLGAGVISLAVAAVPGELIVRMRRYRMHSREVALVLSAEVVRILRDTESCLGARNRADVNEALAHIARCLRYKPVEGARFVDPASRQVIGRRFRSAASAVVEYQGWVSLEQRSTVVSLKQAMESLVNVLTSEMYHYLPEGATEFEVARNRSILGVVLRYAGKLIVASIPLLAVLLISVLSVEIPETLRQWITGIGVLLLLGQLIALLDPRLSWRDVGDLLNAGRKSSPSDKL